MKCPNCNGEGFLIVEDVERYFIRECPECEGEGEIKVNIFKNFGYETNIPCDVCGKKGNNQSEPRFGYVVCEVHYKMSPVEVSEAKYKSE
jgi:DnaJ-class molecular chaperone